MTSSARNLYSKEKKNPFQIPLKYWHYLVSEFLIILDSSLILFVSDLPWCSHILATAVSQYQAHSPKNRELTE